MPNSNEINTVCDDFIYTCNYYHKKKQYAILSLQLEPALHSSICKGLCVHTKLKNLAHNTIGIIQRRGGVVKHALRIIG